MNDAIEQLFLFRKRTHKTLKEVSDYLGVTEGCVSHWERGRRWPSYDILARWADFFGYEIEIKFHPND